MDHRLNAILKYLLTQSQKLNQYITNKNNVEVNSEVDYIKYLEALNNFHPYKLDPIETPIEPIYNNRNKPYGSREPYQAPKSHLISNYSTNRSSSSKSVDDYKIQNRGAKGVPNKSLDKVYHDVREAYNINKVEEELKEDKFEITNEEVAQIVNQFSEGYWERVYQLKYYKIPVEIGLKWYLNELIIKYYNNKYNNRGEVNYYLLTNKGFEYKATFNKTDVSSAYPIGEIFEGEYLLTYLKEKELKELVII